ncbi:ATP-grasp domain-containing protein [Micromonospora sp. NPDC005299]|uniref:ATP-grasp domain-containing protein n=1 Tax=Micromonospora sp. NPDC005299 TaxID=3364231 RepID=UPI0036CD17BF
MSDHAQAVLLLDPVKTGEGYKQAARDLGLRVVSLYTVEQGELNGRWPTHADGDDISLYASTPADIVSAVAEAGLQVVAVVPAMEAGVQLADVLADMSGLPGNDVSLALARRNKAAMRARAAEVGLAIPSFQRVEDLTEVPRVAAAIGYPVILKPTTGAGSHGVTLLSTAADAANLRPTDATDLFGWPVREWLVEQYVRGRELAVNCLSSDGDHQIIDMWEYRQPDGRDYDFPLWNTVQLTPDDPDWSRVEAFVAQVLRAYGVSRGPSHTEVKCNADGVFLIEIGARLAGGPATDLWSAHTSFRPYHDSLECYLGRRPTIMDGVVETYAAYGAIAIRNDVGPGTLTDIHGLAELEAHPNVAKVLVGYAPGDRIPLTQDSKTIPVGAWVSAPDQDALLRVMGELRRMVSLEIAYDGTERG